MQRPARRTGRARQDTHPRPPRTEIWVDPPGLVSYLWRPLPSVGRHATPVRRLWQIGASTHPGPGLGAGSGYLVAKTLTRRRMR